MAFEQKALERHPHDGDLPDAFIRAQIRNSYLLVLRQNVTPKSLREEILAYVGEHGLPE